jgi:pyridoxamine 5'-phosphate oxidase
MDLPRVRKEYEDTGIVEADFGPEPWAHFSEWLSAAFAADLVEPNAMVLSTVDTEGQPAGRFVLCKGISEGTAGHHGIEFYTNYESHKGHHLAANPAAAVTFGWLGLNRQLRMQGIVEKMSPQDSDAYFAKRPPGAQIGAVVSEQSSVLTDRETLERAFADAEGTDPVRPDHWGGYRIVPSLVEFWQGRASRLHDRLRYTRTDDGWILERLAP